MNKWVKIVAAVVFVLVLAGAGAYFLTQTDKPQKLDDVMNVPVYSTIPLAEFQNKTDVILHTSTDKAETTCNLEIAAVSTGNRKGYDIKFERKPMEIYIDKGATYIRGASDDDFLQACHAYVCLREGIACDMNLPKFKNITLLNRDMVIVLDNASGTGAGQAYAELLGALGFVQAQRDDLDHNGIVNLSEMNQSHVYIYPYIKYGDTCQLQKFKNSLETLNITNDTVACDEITSGIFLNPSATNQIILDGRRVIISGDDQHISAESMIVRDILSPEFIRYYYNIK